MVQALLILSVVFLVGCDNRETVLAIEKPTEVYGTSRIPESLGTNFQPEDVIVILKAGERARVIGVYHGKDYDAFQVKLADGTEGLIFAGDTFKVVSWREGSYSHFLRPV